MKRTLVVASALCVALVSPRPAASALYYGFTVGITNAPKPPAVRMLKEPHVVLSGDAMVYVVDDPVPHFDGDMFRYGQYWFAYTNGYWYRARSHRGPYVVMDVRKIPRAIIGVPREMWRHHPKGPASPQPPGLAKGHAKPKHAVTPSSRAQSPLATKSPGRRGKGDSLGAAMVGRAGMADRSTGRSRAGRGSLR